MDRRYIYESLTISQKGDMLTKYRKLGYVYMGGFNYQGLSVNAVDPTCLTDNSYRLYRLMMTMKSLWFKCVREAKDYDEFIKLYDDKFPCLIKEADSIAEKIRESTKYVKDHLITSFIEYLKEKGEAPPICAMERYKEPTEIKPIKKEV